MIKYRQVKKTAAFLLAAAVAAGCLAGCSSGSGSAVQDTTGASDGNVGGTNNDLSSPATSNNDSAYVNPYTLANVNVFGIDFNHYVDVSKWRDTVVTKEEATEPEYLVQYALAYELQGTYKLSTSEITDRAVQGGDTVTIDFTGYVDGEELENGSGTDQTLMIGSGRFIEGFEEGLIGANTGDKRTLELSFPDPYQNNPDLSGKPVTFEVTVKKIQGFENVSDDDINKATEGKFTTYDAFAEDFTASRAKDYQELKIWQKVIENIEQKAVCEELKNDFTNTYLYTYGVMAEAYNMSIETVLYYSYGYKMTVDEFKEALEPMAIDYAVQSCAVLAIADMEGLTVDEQELEDAYKKELENYDSEEKMKESGITKDDIKFSLLLEDVEEHIYSTIQIQ